MKLSEIVGVMKFDLERKGDVELSDTVCGLMIGAMQQAFEAHRCPHCDGKGYTWPEDIAPDSRSCDKCNGTGDKRNAPEQPGTETPKPQAKAA